MSLDLREKYAASQKFSTTVSKVVNLEQQIETCN